MRTQRQRDRSISRFLLAAFLLPVLWSLGLATASAQGGVEGTTYTSNKRPDAECAAWTPTRAEVSFKFREVKQYTLKNVRAPSDVVVTMTNTSGCVVVTRGTITVIGSHGTVYTSDKLPTGGGYKFEHVSTPFGWNLGPAGNEFPASHKFGVIDVCSATPPPKWPASAYFSPLHDGKCAKFIEEAWMNQTVPVNGGRIQQNISPGDPIDITQNDISSQAGQTYAVPETDAKGSSARIQQRGNIWVLAIVMPRRTAKLSVTDAVGQSTDEMVSRFELFFNSEADARNAAKALAGGEH